MKDFQVERFQVRFPVKVASRGSKAVRDLHGYGSKRVPKKPYW